MASASGVATSRRARAADGGTAPRFKEICSLLARRGPGIVVVPELGSVTLVLNSEASLSIGGSPSGAGEEMLVSGRGSAPLPPSRRKYRVRSDLFDWHALRQFPHFFVAHTGLPPPCRRCYRKPMGTTTLLSFEEFEQLPDEPGKVELLDGELIQLPPAKFKHMEVVRRIMALLMDAVDKAGASANLGAVYPETGYKFGKRAWLQPEIGRAH